jgi:hypothetical protein
MENLAALQIAWLCDVRKSTKLMPLDVVQALLRDEIINRTDRRAMPWIAESASALLHRDDVAQRSCRRGFETQCPCT